MIKSNSLKKNRTINNIKSNYLYYYGLIVIIICLVYGSYLSPMLYYDDWGQFAYNYFKGNLPWFIPGFVRPLTFAVYRFETDLLGLDLYRLMILRIGLLSISCLLFFILLEKLHVFSRILNFFCSLVILFTPVDMTRMWLLLDPIMIICVQIYMVCLIIFHKRHNFWILFIGLVFGFGSLLYYEVQLGLLMAFPVFLFFYSWITEKKHNWWLSLPFFLGIGYLLIRIFGSVIGLESFHSSQTISIIFILRQIRNAIVSFVGGWILPLQMDEEIRNSAFVIFLISLCIFFYHLLKYGFEKMNMKQMKRSLMIFGFGSFFWLAGYFPWVAYGIPSSTHWFSSRVHNTAIPGSVIAIIIIFEIIGSLVRVSPIRKQILSALLILPFLIIGTMSQIAIQRESKILWNDYRAMWKGIFESIPDFRNNPHIVLVITPDLGNLRYGEREYFTSASYNAEISKAFGMFYANDVLEGEFMYKNLELTDTPSLHENGIKNPPSYSGEIPYSDILFIEFNRDTKKVTVVRDLENEFGIKNSTYNADKFIDKKSLLKNTLRFIFDN